eukprot:4713509-Alexandrium_andersonii.AAC.1
MSASLVGSEMCIRDRRGAAQQGVGQSGYLANHAPPASQEELRSRGSVSYTHLTLPTICSV